MHGPHFPDERKRPGWLVGLDLLAEDGLDVIFAASERDHQIWVIMDVELVGFAWLEPNFPDADKLVLEQDPLPDLAQRDAAVSRCWSPYLSAMYHSWTTAMALISIR